MKIAVVGATGMVGEIMLKVLAERNFPVTELIPVASERSVGKEIEFKGKKYKVVGMQTAVDMKADIALFSAGIFLGTISKSTRLIKKLHLSKISLILNFMLLIISLVDIGLIIYVFILVKDQINLLV